ncbi:MAG: cation:proton antiporter [Actinobacteria bacterium]|nr:cation:proton antiporter [Actinomycetota bacterium]MCB8997078.1 cation:proton antiporter [Actinomycetota bacterium]MCB9425187.1 cation:proton antiporter [Actinomycetota bacterium]HRY09160.1 cation:proton antiporter [Candidatus Nanopelagicales bacterium]
MDPLKSLFWVVLVAALAPIAARLLPGRLPAVVFMLIGGVLIGPEVFAHATPEDMSLLSTIGLSFLFLLAGYELEPQLIREPAGKTAVRSWFVSATLAIGVTAVLYYTGVITDFIEIAIALTTTALGTLLPILRDAGLMAGRFGQYIFAAGAAGEFLPIVAMALLLTSTGPVGGLVALFGMALATLIALLIIRWVKRQEWGSKLMLPEDSTGQNTLRWTLVLLAGLVLVADDFGLDVVLGAFLAGVVLRQWAPVSAESLERKLETVGYGVFIPIFFVTSGMKLDIVSILENPGRLLLFFVLLFSVRGLPQLVMYRGQLDRTQRWQMVFLTATALPLLVALADVGTASGLMLPENAAALVGAGALSVVVFPLVATGLTRSSTGRAAETSGGAAAS